MSDGQLTITDLALLSPAFNQASLDYEAMLEQGKISLQTQLEKSSTTDQIDVANLPESDPIVKLLQVLAYRELHIRQRISEAKRACSLASATGEDLKNIVVYSKNYCLTFPSDCCIHLIKVGQVLLKQLIMFLK